MDRAVIISSTIALILYLNTLNADFAYDDNRAIKTNQDLRPETPITSIFLNDFWGTPLNHSGSHKSYRPLCVLSFRLNYYLSGLKPCGYHLTNVFLHSIVTGLFTHLARKLLHQTLPTLVAGTLFAVHPIHTEAVAGVVGRADVGACFFFLLSFIFYARYCDLRDHKLLVTSRELHSQCSRCDSNGTNSNSCDKNCNVWPLIKTSAYKRWTYIVLMLLSTAASLLTKEQGITVLAVNGVYDVFINNRIRLKEIPRLWKREYRKLHEGCLCLFVSLLVLVSSRLYLIGNQPPDFAPSDNPASDSDSLSTRFFTFLYLPVLNFGLLLFPWTLSFDWSMEAVPLVTSIHDSRIILTVAFYSLLLFVIVYIFKSVNKSTDGNHSDLVQNGKLPTVNGVKHMNGVNIHHVLKHTSQDNGHHVFRKVIDGSVCNNDKTVEGLLKRTTSKTLNGISSSHKSMLNGHAYHIISDVTSSQSKDVLLMCLTLMILPFLPATNLFFYVGFVIAERVLYIPSMGYCLLVAYGFNHLIKMTRDMERKKCGLQMALHAVLGILVISYSARTILRNKDWESEESLYKSGLTVNPAKAWGNLANILNNQGKNKEAEAAYRRALQHRGNMADVHYNLGILLQDMKRYEEAVASYQMAIKCRPRLAAAHLNLGIVLALLGNKDEAAVVYRHCSTLDGSGLKDPKTHENTKISCLYNLGRVLAEQEDFQGALEVYHEAVSKMTTHYPPQSLYNMLGEAYFRLGKLQEAETWYRKALKAKSDHIPAHLTLAKLYYKTGRIIQSEELFDQAKELAPDDPAVYQHHGQYLAERGNIHEAAQEFMKAAKLSPSEFEVMFNAANTLRQAGENEKAETFYRAAVNLKPDAASAHMNLGAMLHVNGKLSEAEKAYQEALKLNPGDQITQNNLRKLRNLLRKQEL